MHRKSSSPTAHRIFSVAAAISLVLCLAMMVRFAFVVAGHDRWLRILTLGDYSIIFGGDEIQLINDGYIVGGFPVSGLALILSAGPILWAMRWRKERVQRRLRRGLCSRCGYDLRATPDRCPECGTVPGE